MESTESTSRAGNREDKEPSVLNRPLGKGGPGARHCAAPARREGRAAAAGCALRSALPRRSVRCRCAAPGAVGGHGALRASVPGEPPPRRAVVLRALLRCCAPRGAAPALLRAFVRRWGMPHLGARCAFRDLHIAKQSGLHHRVEKSDLLLREGALRPALGTGLPVCGRAGGAAAPGGICASRQAGMDEWNPRKLANDTERDVRGSPSFCTSPP